MFNLEWPWFLLLLPLPLAVYYFLKPAKHKKTCLFIPFYQHLHTETDKNISKLFNKLTLIFLCIIWFLSVISASQPQWIGKPTKFPVSGRDIMLAVDLSGSMEIPDLKIKNNFVSRLEVTKHVISEFILHRKGDRLGLIVFGTHAFLQAPLTFDLQTLKILLNETSIAIAGEKTAIGDAIGLSVKHLRKRPKDHRILILLTDGSNNTGDISPERATEIAVTEHVKIYTIGVGSEEMIQPGLFGGSIGARRVNPSADLDEKLLTNISQQTGGRFFRAKNTEELKEIYELLNKLEPIEQDPETFRPIKALYYWPLGIALILSFILAIRLTALDTFVIKGFKK